VSKSKIYLAISTQLIGMCLSWYAHIYHLIYFVQHMPCIYATHADNNKYNANTAQIHLPSPPKKTSDTQTTLVTTSPWSLFGCSMCKRTI